MWSKDHVIRVVGFPPFSQTRGKCVDYLPEESEPLGPVNPCKPLFCFVSIFLPFFFLSFLSLPPFFLLHYRHCSDSIYTYI